MGEPGSESSTHLRETIATGQPDRDLGTGYEEGSVSTLKPMGSKHSGTDHLGASKQLDSDIRDFCQ